MPEIRESAGVDCWRYVPTDCNSADVATRYNKKLKIKEVLWWKGPSFLCEVEEVWPRSKLSSDCGDVLDLNQEMGKALIAPAFSSVSVEGNICCVVECEMYSSLEKLLKVICFVKRFVRSLNANSKTTRLSNLFWVSIWKRRTWLCRSFIYKGYLFFK